MNKIEAIMSIIVVGIVILVGIGFFWITLEDMENYEEKLEEFELPAVTNVFYVIIVVLSISLFLTFYLWRIGGEDNGKGEERREG